MRTRWTIAALAGLSAGLAQARRGTLTKAPSNPPVVSKAWALRPDLTCEVRAWRDEAKAVPLSDGGSFNTHFAPGEAWIELRARNVGAAMQTSAPVTLLVNSGGSVQTHSWSAWNLVGGSTLVFPTVKVQIDFSGSLSSTEVWALGKTDPYAQLDERLEENNSCQIGFRYSYGP